MNPRLTIGLPVYNAERHLREAIESLLSQSYGDFRLIVSDNASTDATAEIVHGYAERDSRIVYRRNERNIGLAANYNLVFRMAETPYFRWGASDDVCLPDFLKRCVECLDRESDTVLAYTKTRFIDADGNLLDLEDRGFHLPFDDPVARFRVVLESASWVNAIMGVIRTGALARTGLIPSYSSGDFGLLGELCLLGKFREIPECLFLRRLHARSSSQHMKQASWMEWYWSGRSAPFTAPLWKRFRHHAKTVARSELPVRDKAALGLLLVRTMIWRRDRLRREFVQAVASWVPRGSRPRGEAP